jgi:hypothetical protein
VDLDLPLAVLVWDLYLSFCELTRSSSFRISLSYLGGIILDTCVVFSVNEEVKKRRVNLSVWLARGGDACIRLCGRASGMEQMGWVD